MKMVDFLDKDIQDEDLACIMSLIDLKNQAKEKGIYITFMESADFFISAYRSKEGQELIKKHFENK